MSQVSKRFGLAAGMAVLSMVMGYAISSQSASAQVPGQNPAAAPLPAGQVRAGGAAGTRPKMTSKKFLIPGMHLSSEIPVNFPVPTYPSNVTKKDFVNSTKGSPTAGVTIITGDDVATVFDWYLKYFAREKWAVKTPSAAAMEKLHPKTRLYFLEATRERNMINLVCTPYSKGGTLITVSWAAISK